MGTNRYLNPNGVVVLELILGERAAYVLPVISCDNDVRITKVYADPTKVTQYFFTM